MARDDRDWPTTQLRRRPRTLWSDLAGLWRRFVGLPLAVRIGAAVVATVLVLVVLLGLFGSGDGEDVVARQRVPSTSLPPATSTTVALPPGDDKTVKDALDGDSLEATDGTKIRLIGIDAPDVETRGCFSGEATTHLRELLAPDSPVRVVYDADRTDRLGRTLAYLYRPADGLFVNAAMARDGFARQLTTPPNTAHAEEIKTAVSEAVAERRGMWQSCQMTTTTRRAPTTTRRPAPTSTPSPPTSAPVPNPGPVPGAVERDAPCPTPGAPGQFSDGTPAVCGGDGGSHWVPAADTTG
ncbi:MAG TPA: thermonuclease family protein [Acidimicrobiales bacterium]|nr:thermonuclease family protein [Acidimicrobiales bacterium]